MCGLTLNSSKSRSAACWPVSFLGFKPDEMAPITGSTEQAKLWLSGNGLDSARGDVRIPFLDIYSRASSLIQNLMNSGDRGRGGVALDFGDSFSNVSFCKQASTIDA